MDARRSRIVPFGNKFTICINLSGAEVSGISAVLKSSSSLDIVAGPSLGAMNIMPFLLCILNSRSRNVFRFIASRPCEVSLGLSENISNESSGRPPYLPVIPPSMAFPTGEVHTLVS